MSAFRPPPARESRVSDRVEIIRKMLAEGGDDVFLIYSLGMELSSAGRFGEAVEQFRRCLELDGQYLPAFAELGKALRSSGRLEEAREAFVAGMDLAAQQGEAHVRDYLQQQVDSLPAQQ
jgi:Flp pilus assembly protein TadD